MPLTLERVDATSMLTNVKYFKGRESAACEHKTASLAQAIARDRLNYDLDSAIAELDDADVPPSDDAIKYARALFDRLSKFPEAVGTSLSGVTVHFDGRIEISLPVEPSGRYTVYIYPDGGTLKAIYTNLGRLVHVDEMQLSR